MASVKPLISAHAPSLGSHRGSLHYAAWSGDIEFVEKYIHSGVDIFIEVDGYTALQLAIFNMHTRVVQILLENTPFPMGSKVGFAALELAVQNDDTQVMKWLSGMGVEASPQRKSGLLNRALVHGSINTATELIHAGADVRGDRSDTMPPLVTASSINAVDLIIILLDAGAPIEAPGPNGLTALHAAAGFGQVEAAKVLIDAGADISARASRGFTPLHAAVSSTRAFLWERIMSWMKTGSRGPLTAASTTPHDEVVQLLIRSGANVSCRDYEGSTPIFAAAERGRICSMIALIEAGADVSCLNNDGMTPIFSAARGGQANAIKLLSDSGAKISGLDNDGNTPMHVAAENGMVEAIKALQEVGASVSIGNSKGWTPMHAAAQKGEVEALKVLKEFGADVASRETENGWQPLHVAAKWGQFGAVAELISFDADVFSRDYSGNTPFNLFKKEDDSSASTAELDLDDVDLDEILDNPEYVDHVLSKISESSWGQLCNLIGIHLVKSFEETGSVEDLNRAVTTELYAVALTTIDAPKRVMYLNNLCAFLSVRFGKEESIDDINNAIIIRERIVSSMSDDDPDFVYRLKQWGDVIELRFHYMNTIDDLDKLIEIRKNTAIHAEDDDPELIVYFNKWADALYNRFVQMGVTEDLEHAITVYEQAIEASTLEDYKGSVGGLDNLGNTLRFEFAQGDIANVPGLTVTGPTAIEDGSAIIAEICNNLGRALESRFEITGSMNDFKYSVSMREKVVNFGTATPFLRIQAAEAVSRLLVAQNQYTRAKEVLLVAVELLPIVHPRTLNNHMSLAASITARAVSVLLACGEKPDYALQLSELGRGVLTNLQLEFCSDLSALSKVHPDLAEKFWDILNEFGMPQGNLFEKYC